MNHQIAEQAAERQMLLGRNLLVAEENDEVLGLRAMNFVLLTVGERPRQINPADLGADDRRQLVYRNRLVGPALVGPMPIAGAASQGFFHGHPPSGQPETERTPSSGRQSD
jgi:hypothetical protein